MEPRGDAGAASTLDPTSGEVAPADVPMSSRRTRKPSLTLGLVAQARPKQWVKNVLVLVAPLAAGVVQEPGVAGRLALAFLSFCLVSSATYYLNDAMDVEADRQHPTKRFRPMASGRVPVKVGLVGAAVLLVSGLALALLLGAGTFAVVAVYCAMTTAYSTRLKHVAGVEIVVVAAGFVLRAVAGGVAAPVPLSGWFLVVSTFAALFVVAGKRHGEIVSSAGSSASRRSLDHYSAGYLRFVYMLTASVTSVAYVLWAAQQADGSPNPVLYQLSVLPFVLAVLRYAFRLEQGHGGAPEDVILHDRQLLLLGSVWAVTFALGVYLP